MSEEIEDRSGRSWEEYWIILLRRRWWILLPLFVCWGAVWAIGWLLPVEYQSESVLGLDRQTMPEQYVTPGATFNLPDWVQTTAQEVLTRPRLQQMIDQLHLSAGSDAWGDLFNAGDRVDRLRQAIKIELIESPGHPGNFTAFKILFPASSPEVAREANGQVASLFISESAIARRQALEDTSDFLDDELARAREDMTAQEDKIAAFKEQHLGQLPSESEANVQIIGELQSQWQNPQRPLDAAREQKLYLDSLLQEYRSGQLNGGTESPDASGSQSLDKVLTDLRLRLESLRSQYTEDYPDITVVKEEIAKTEELKKRLADQGGSVRAGDPGSGSEGSSATGNASRSVPPPIIQARSQLQANALEIQDDQQRERDLQSQIATYQSRLTLAPETEQALDELSSGYDESKRNYDSLLQKQTQSRLATNLEEKQGGEQLQILDPPSLPQRPSSPNRLRVSLAGLVIGLAIGLGLAITRELTDARIRTDEELDVLVSAPLLVAVPRLSTPRECASLRVRAWLEVIAAMAIVSLIVAGNLCSLYKG